MPTSTAVRKFGAYDLHFEIGKDALSTTYLAKNPALEGFLSLRIFNERITDSAQVRSIQKAALKAAELTHPSHVCVYDNGIGENQEPFVVTEWIEGERLADLFQRKKRLDIASFLNIFNQTCDVLAEAHSRRLVHGNLSPQKIILATNAIDADVVKVIDFGMPVDPVQNAFYMSPEQSLDADRVNERSDIYSLGCVMYESLVGRPPSLGSQASANSVDFLHELANQYSKESQEHNALKLLDCIIKRCLQKKPSKRFSSVRELMNALALVADCFNHPGTRKLPRQAEKLLLFRFLDLFDKKITAALTAYLLLGLFATKYIGEIQLEKFIDEAQMSDYRGAPEAEQANWQAALKQADALKKPPSLLAILHYNLADTYRMQAATSQSGSNRNSLAKEAIAQYEQAYEYYKHGPHYRSFALSLLGMIGILWNGMSDEDLQVNRRAAVLAQVRKLANSKNYAACAKDADNYLSKAYDAEICSYAAKANYELGSTAPPAKAINYFARARFYREDASENTPEYSQLCTSMEKLKVMWQFGNTDLHYACNALLAGDEAAAGGFLSGLSTGDGLKLQEALNRYRQLRWSTYQRVENDPYKQKAIKPLEAQLAICENAYGEHGESLIPILTNLAENYRIVGDNQKAIKAYERVVSIQPESWFNYNEQLLSYVDLLSQNGQAERVPAILEKRLLHHGKLDGFDPLIIRLIEAYRTLGRHQQAQDALSEMVTIPEAVPYNPHYLFVSPSTQITPAQIERAAKEQARARAIRSADPFASEAPQATPKATGPGDANF